jgi:hypothetical protein
MTPKEELLLKGNPRTIWQRCCGFLDLSLVDFMEIQKELLLQQIDLIRNSPLARKFMPGNPQSVSEFRQLVPLTTYDDYAPYLRERSEDVLAVKPYCWGHTSGRGGTFKWVPYTEGAVEISGIYATGVFLLACATRKGEVNIKAGVRVLHNLPPPPYMAGILNQLLTPRTGAWVIPPLGKYEDVDFETRIKVGFEIALRSGVDILSSLTSVLVKMGERFTHSSGQMKFQPRMLHPQILFRLIQAWLRSKRENRVILPKDLWRLKGLICYGTDTDIYKEQLIYYWGKEPLQCYGATEAPIIAIQAWNKKYMTFTPASCFLEFAPEEEWLKSQHNRDYQPATVLLDEVEVGERYELIITSFYGMPFLRYRLGDLTKVVALEDEEAGIKLPQIIFDSRADDLIDLAGFPRLDEKTLWQAIANTGIGYEDWSARKEYEQDQPVIRLYIEAKDKVEAKEVETLVHEQLLAINEHYRDFVSMIGVRPLRVLLLPQGTFNQYYEDKQRCGAALAHLKPPHMNAPDNVIEDLLSHLQST